MDAEGRVNDKTRKNKGSRSICSMREILLLLFAVPFFGSNPNSTSPKDKQS